MIVLRGVAVGGSGENVGVSSVPGRRRTALTGLIILSLSLVALVAGLGLVQGGGSGQAAATSTAAVTTAAATTAAGAAPTGALPQVTVEDPDVPHTPVSGLPTVAEADLPREAHETLDLIRDGGPFPYRQDDGTFFNREGILPDQPRGYYREYTVETRGSPDRGARRVVAGDGGDLYYTADHYDSFEQIEEGR